MNRGLWFVAGAGAGVYAMTKARRAAEMFTPEGWSDRVSSLSLGAQLFTEEFRTARDARATELRDRLGLPTDGTLALAPAERPQHAPALTPDHPKELN